MHAATNVHFIAHNKKSDFMYHLAQINLMREVRSLTWRVLQLQKVTFTQPIWSNPAVFLTQEAVASKWAIKQKPVKYKALFTKKVYIKI